MSETSILPTCSSRVRTGITRLPKVYGVIPEGPACHATPFLSPLFRVY